jgi:hypothetical protein
VLLIPNLFEVETEDFPAVGEEGIDQICADESRSTGYEDPCYEDSRILVLWCGLGDLLIVAVSKGGTQRFGGAV